MADCHEAVKEDAGAPGVCRAVSVLVQLGPALVGQHDKNRNEGAEGSIEIDLGIYAVGGRIVFVIRCETFLVREQF